jgi:hypothetical protein
MQNYNQRIVFLVIIILILTLSLKAEALIINGYDADVHDRFISGTYSGSPVVNPNFIGSDYDFSGVGWQTNQAGRSVTLISPQHFVAANHYQIPVGESVSFYNQSGELKNYIVEGYSTFSIEDSGITHVSDLVVGKLTESISASDGISHYKVLDADDYTTDWYDINWYVDKDIYTYGTYGKAGVNKIDYFASTSTMPLGSNPDNATLCAVYDTHATGDYVNEAGAQGGDSGSPSFIVHEGELTLLGTHFAINGNTSSTWRTYDAFAPAYLDEIDAIVNDDGYQVERIVIDVFPSKMKNGDFETWNSTDWTPYGWEHESTSSGALISRSTNSSERVISGEKSLSTGERIFSSAGNHSHSEYYRQTITGAKLGQQYAFSFWYLNTIEIARTMLIDNAQLTLMAGIDPAGGIDPDSEDVIWQMLVFNPDDFSANWQQMIITAMATEEAMTFFISRELLASISAADVTAGKYWSANTYFDNSQISSVPEPSTFMLLGLSLFSLIGYRKKN